MQVEVNLKNIILEKEGNLAVITINRPKALNALNSETLKELDTVIETLENDKYVYCVIVTGSGDKAFVAGADISEMKDLNSDEAEEFGLLGNNVFRRLENLDKPVIAAISGFALGVDATGVFTLGALINSIVSMFIVGPYLSIFNARSIGLLYTTQI